jgi:hypothetical protein
MQLKLQIYNATRIIGAAKIKLVTTQYNKTSKVSTIGKSFLGANIPALPKALFISKCK